MEIQRNRGFRVAIYDICRASRVQSLAYMREKSEKILLPTDYELGGKNPVLPALMWL
jgi:hypothetical protein